MADDVKIQLGIDIEALQRSATAATNILSKTFEQQNLGPSLLGSGVAATQLPQQGKDTLRGVIDALEKIERTLTTGFMSLAGAGYATAATTWQMAKNGMGGGGQGGPQEDPNKPKPGGGGMGAVDRAVGPIYDTAKAVAGPLNSAIDSGGYSGDMYKLGGAALNSPAGNLLGPLKYGARIFFDYMNGEQQKKEDFRSQQYDMWKSGGDRGMKGFTDAWTTSDYFDSGPEKRYGISMQQSADLRKAAAMSGGDVNATLQAEGTLGQGAMTAGLSGALRKSGNKGDIDELAKIIGTAINVGLDQSRFPDAMAAVQRAAESSTATNLNLQRELSIMSFIGAGGAGFQPGSAKYDTQRAGLEAMASDTSSPMAMLNAWNQSGHNYGLMMSMMEKGTGEGGVDISTLIERFWNTQEVQAWADSIDETHPDGDPVLLANASLLLKSKGVSKSQTIIENALKARAKQKMGANATTGQNQVGSDIINGGPPEDASAKARADARKQQKGIQGSFGYIQDTGSPTGTPQSRASAIDNGNAHANPVFSSDPASRGTFTTAPTDFSGGVSQGVVRGVNNAVRGPDASRTQIDSAAQAYGINPQFVRDWIRVESAGHLHGSDTASGTGWTARGYGQLSPVEMRAVGVTSPEDIQRMSTDPAFSLDKSVQKMSQYRARAEQQAKKLGWTNPVDIDRLAKFHHGVSGDAETLVNNTQEKSWGAFAASMVKAFTEALAHDHGRRKEHDKQVLDALANANKIEVTTSPGVQVRPAGPKHAGAAGQMTALQRGGFR